MDPGGRQRETSRALCSEKDRPPAESTPATSAGAANGVCPARAEFTRLTQGSAPAGTVLRGGQVSARLFHRSSMSAGGRHGSRAGYDWPPRVSSGAFLRVLVCPRAASVAATMLPRSSEVTGTRAGRVPGSRVPLPRGYCLSC